jgi:hypothetical protein
LQILRCNGFPIFPSALLLTALRGAPPIWPLGPAGNNASGVLLGIQVPPEDDEEFNASGGCCAWVLGMGSVLFCFNGVGFVAGYVAVAVCSFLGFPADELGGTRHLYQTVT